MVMYSLNYVTDTQRGQDCLVQNSTHLVQYEWYNFSYTRRTIIMHFIFRV